MSQVPNSAQQGSPVSSSGGFLSGLFLGSTSGEFGAPAVQGVQYAGTAVSAAANNAAAYTANELASAYDWSKAAVTDIAGSTKKSILDTLGLFDAGVNAASDTVQGAGAAALGVGTILLVGGIFLALYLFSKRDTIIEHAASGAGAAAAAGAGA